MAPEGVPFYRSKKGAEQDIGRRELGLVAFKGQGHGEAGARKSGTLADTR